MNTIITAQRESYLAAMNAHGVKFSDVAWTSEVTPAAANKHHVLTKRVSATVATGLEYKNLAVNNDRETGELPWGQWLVYPFIVQHTDKDGVYREYARLYTIPGTVRAAYFVDGKEVKGDAFRALLTPSVAKKDAPRGGTVTVKLENLIVL